MPVKGGLGRLKRPRQKESAEYPRAESNRYFILRRNSFYSLNYGGEWQIARAVQWEFSKSASKMADLPYILPRECQLVDSGWIGEAQRCMVRSTPWYCMGWEMQMVSTTCPCASMVTV